MNHTASARWLEQFLGRLRLQLIIVLFQKNYVSVSASDDRQPQKGRAAEDILHASLSWRDLSRKDV